MDGFGLGTKCCSCDVTDGDEQITDCSGSFSTGSQAPSDGVSTAHITSSTNALRYFQYPTRDNEPWIVSTTAELAVAAQGAEHVILRLIGGLVDCDNYVALEWEFENLGFHSGAGGWWTRTQVRLVDVVLGVASVVARHPWDVTYYVTGSSPLSMPTTSRDLLLWWDGDVLTGLANGTRIATRDATPAGTHFGVGTGNYMTDISSVTFKTLVGRRARSAELPSCPASQESCCKSNIPPNMVIEVAENSPGSMGAGYHYWIVGSYRIACSQFLGSWVVPLGDTHPHDVRPSLGDASCIGTGAKWSAQFTVQVETSLDGIAWTPETRPMGGEYFVVMLTLDRVAGELVVEFGIANVLGGTYGFVSFPNGVLAKFVVSTSAPCDTWTDWLTMTQRTPPAAQCPWTDVTVRVKKQ